MVQVAKDITGQKFGKLSVIKRSDNSTGGSIVWVCKCDCGNTHETSSINLRKGWTKSCGCIRKGRPKGSSNKEPRKAVKQKLKEKGFTQVEAIKQLAEKFGGTPKCDFTESARQVKISNDNGNKVERKLSANELGLKEAKAYAARRFIG